MSKTVRISLESIMYAYGTLTGDLGAKLFVKESLNEANFDLNKSYTKRTDLVTKELVFTQE